MVSYDQAKDFTLTTDANSSKIFTTGDFSFSSGAISLGAGAFVLRNYSIPLSTATRFFDILVNISQQPGQFKPIDRFEYLEDGGDRRYSFQMSASGSNATLSLYLVAGPLTATTFPAFNILVKRRDFLDEI